VLHRAGLCHLFLEPPKLKNYHIYDLKSAREMYDIGYEHTLDLAPEIEALLKTEE
jgi:NTE family protein